MSSREDTWRTGWDSGAAVRTLRAAAVQEGGGQQKQ